MSDKNTEIQRKIVLNVNGHLLDFSVPKVMGIINLTPDSFYQAPWKVAGSLPLEVEIINQAERMLSEGADIIDMGAYSSRPNAQHISSDEELKRLLGALKIVVKKFPQALISVDTFRSEVARAAVNEGAVMINDISAGEIDPKMFKTIADLDIAYIMMHMKGTPQTMQDQATYKDVFLEVHSYLKNKLEELKAIGLNKIIIDPGFGFAKTLEQNYSLLDKLDHFLDFGLPLLAGLSRKSMIYKLLNTNAEAALNGTIAANTIALMKGASILRVHDVKPACEAIKITQQLSK